MWDVYLYEAQNNKGNGRAIDNKDGQREEMRRTR